MHGHLTYMFRCEAGMRDNTAMIQCREGTDRQLSCVEQWNVMLHALEPRDKNLRDTSWSAFNYYLIARCRSMAGRAGI